MEWNFADVFEAIAGRVPERKCLVQGPRVVTWQDMDRRAGALAADMVGAGLAHQSNVAAYLYNCPEFIETYVAAFKGGFVPVNTNYRYGPEEIVYLFDNADVEAVIFHAAFGDVLADVRPRLGRVRRWYVVADETGEGPDWAAPYEAVVSGVDRVVTPWGRSGDDLLLMYTGGTTGMPKGVMWRQDDLFNALGAGGNPLIGVPAATSLDELVSRLPDAPSPVLLPACPLMHGTGLFTALITMMMAGTIALSPSPKLDVEELWTEVERTGATNLVIVGQAFAAPMLRHLDENPGRYDLSRVALISSAGVMWSQDNKSRLLGHLPQVILFDSLSSSEALGIGGSVSTSASTEQTARFALGENTRVFTDDGQEVEPGSGEQGMIAVGGYIPVGYYKDEAKTAQTFRTFAGRRWSVPGDWAEVNADGTVLLLGRGSMCINTGGEKVFPEEVEEVLKMHPGVRDAVAVGVPDERFGEVICAVIEPLGDAVPTLTELADLVRSRLAAYKAPRHIVLVDTIGRAPSGKVDYKRLKVQAANGLQSGSVPVPQR